MNEKEPQQPVKEFRSKTITAAVWRNEHEEQGTVVSRYSVRIRKRWHDRRTGEWKDTDYYFADDLPRLCLVAEKAFEYITLKESEEDADLPTVAR